jgi:hypothetical protein
MLPIRTPSRSRSYRMNQALGPPTFSAGVDAAFSLTRMIPEADRKDALTDGGARAGDCNVSNCAQT